MAKPRRPSRPTRRPSREQGEITPGVREEARHRVFMGKWAKTIIELGTLRTVEVKALLEQGRRELGITEDSRDPYPGLPWEHAIKLDAQRRPIAWNCSRCRFDGPAVTQTVRQFVDPITIEYARQTRAADTEINRTVTRTEDIADAHNERAVNTQVRSTVAADASIPDLASAFLINKEQGISNATKNTFIKRNIALIKIDGGGGVTPIPAEHVKRMTRILDLGIRRNTNHVSIARELRDLNGITARRSRTIAIDQINKHNSSMSRTRHKQMGFDFYFWNNQGDGKVRPEHEERQGIEFAYAQPPPDGNPGVPVRCRCWAQPNIRRAIGLAFEPPRTGSFRTGDPKENALSLARGKAEAARRTARAAKRSSKEAAAISASAKQGSKTAAAAGAKRAASFERASQRASVRAELALGELA